MKMENIKTKEIDVDISIITVKSCLQCLYDAFTITEENEKVFKKVQELIFYIDEIYWGWLEKNDYLNLIDQKYKLICEYQEINFKN